MVYSVDCMHNSNTRLLNICQCMVCRFPGSQWSQIGDALQSLTGTLIIQPVELSVPLIHMTQNSIPIAANSSHILRNNCTCRVHLTFVFVLGLMGL